MCFIVSPKPRLIHQVAHSDMKHRSRPHWVMVVHLKPQKARAALRPTSNSASMESLCKTRQCIHDFYRYRMQIPSHGRKSPFADSPPFLYRAICIQAEGPMCRYLDYHLPTRQWMPFPYSLKSRTPDLNETEQWLIYTVYLNAGWGLFPIAPSEKSGFKPVSWQGEPSLFLLRAIDSPVRLCNRLRLFRLWQGLGKITPFSFWNGKW